MQEGGVRVGREERANSVFFKLTTQIPCSWRTKGLIHDKKTEPFRLLAWSWCLNDEQFLGFGSDEEVRVRSPTRSPSAKSSPRKPRGRPRSGSDRTPLLPDPPAFPPLSKPETRPGDKIKKKDSKSLEKKRGRPPTFPGVKIKITHGKDIAELPKGSKDDSLKKLKRTPSATFQQATKIKKLRAGKLSPLKSKFKAGKLQIGRKGVQIVRRRGRPPSAERVKAPAGLLLNSHLDKPQKVRRDADAAPALAKEDKAVVRQSPRRVKPVRIIPSSKRTDATIAKQLLQRAKKGAQKKIEKEAAQLQGRKVKTQVKNIRQFIMPVVSAISSRIIKTPRRFIEDEDYDPPIKIARLEPAPSSRFGAASCGSSEKSSAASQHSSQLSSDSSRSSSPSVDTSTDSQASEEIQGLPEEQSDAPEAHAPLPVAQSPESDRNDRRGRRYSVSEREPARERDADKSAEKDKSRERDREREKENKRESRKEKRKKGSEPQGSSALYPAGRVSKEKAGAEEGAAPSSAKKVTGRKKSSSLDSGPERWTRRRRPARPRPRPA
ncbi:PREDICTED: histone-lysine N-methyltransferase 2A-like [Myotis davidii]|uniref:histone-lysine N-methyltransferase 2A-like n=1 Tax=Myotis davidii TaxID=225400 RepID=UPI00076758AE|nr:PREDICTED: histone-lysine N-methyltransferase 2A-like [Myotis davidii]